MQERSWRGRLAQIALIGAIALAGCGESSEAWAKPQEPFRAFLMHWFMGRPTEAFALLSAADRAALEQTSAALKRKLGDAAPAPEAILVGSAVATPYDFKKIEVTPPLTTPPSPGDRATLALEFLDGRQGQAQLVWEDASWKLTLGLKTAP